MFELHERIQGIVYHVCVVGREKVIGYLQTMFIGCGGGRLWNKGNMERCITPLLLGRRDFKLEC